MGVHEVGDSSPLGVRDIVLTAEPGFQKLDIWHRVTAYGMPDIVGRIRDR
jgi:hypothetical protein